MALKDIARDAAVEIGVLPPLSITADANPTAQKLLLFAKRSLKEAATSHDWTALATEGTITGDGVTTSWPVPPDFDRLALAQRVQRKGDTAYQLFGPLNADQRVNWRARTVNAINPVFWFRGGKIIISPALAIGQLVYYEYQSSFLVNSSAMATKLTFDNENDISRLDEELVILGLVWMWKRSSGLDYGQEFNTWQARFELLAGRDQSQLPVYNGMSDIGLADPVMPDTIVIA